MYTAEIVFAILVAPWCALAWHYADPRPHRHRWTAAVLSLLLPFVGLLVSIQAAAIAAAAVLAVTLTWYLRLRPSNDHEWETEYARAPVARRDDSLMHVADVRNFRYRGVTEPVPAWYDATYDLDTLTGVDLICSYWAGPAIAHVFLSFGFADGRHLAVSVETRRRRHQRYSAIAGFLDRKSTRLNSSH